MGNAIVLIYGFLSFYDTLKKIFERGVSTYVLALHDWQNFYLLTGTASATLIGLLFVAASISMGTNLSLQQATNSLRTYVNPILLYYVQALVISCVSVMPLASSVLLSVVLIVLGSIDSMLTGKVCWRMIVLHREKTIGVDHWIWHIVFPFCTGILSIGVAIGMLTGLPLALGGLSIVDLLCLAIGLRNTWALTVWLLLHRDGLDHKQDEPLAPPQDAIYP